MFKLTPDATFPFTAVIPNGTAPLPIKLKGRRKSREDLAAFMGSARERSDTELLADAVAGWEDVDADFSTEALGQLLTNYAGASLAIFTAYIKAHSEAERKN